PRAEEPQVGLHLVRAGDVPRDGGVGAGFAVVEVGIGEHGLLVVEHRPQAVELRREPARLLEREDLALELLLRPGPDRVPAEPAGSPPRRRARAFPQRGRPRLSSGRRATTRAPFLSSSLPRRATRSPSPSAPNTSLRSPVAAPRSMGTCSTSPSRIRTTNVFS